MTTRRTLAEGGAPGAVLDCDDPRDARLSRRTGWARIWAERPRKVAFPPDERFTTTGSGRQAVLALPAGRWEISLAYTSPVPVTVGLGDGQEVEMPPNLDRPGPWWRVADVTQAETGGRRIDLHVADQALRSPNRFAELIGVAAVDLDAGRRLVPLGEACGRYVDWYVLGPERPTAPIQGG